ALTNYQFEQLFGHQSSTFFSKPQQLSVLLLIVAGSMLLIALNKRNVGPVVLLFSVFGMYWGFLVFSPILAENYINGTALRLHNAVYVTVPAYVSIFSLAGPPGPAAWLRRRYSRWSGVAGAGAVMLVVVAAALAGNAYTANGWTRYQSSHEFWDGVRSTTGTWDDPAKTVLPLQGPDSVADAWAVPNGRVDQLLPFVAQGWKPGDLTDQPVIVTSTGQVDRAALQLVSTTQPVTPDDPGSGSLPAGCMDPTSPSQTYSFTADRPSSVGPFLARVTYTADGAGQIRAVPMANLMSPEFSGLPTDIPAGTHQIVLQLGLDSIDSLWIDSMAAGSRICLQRLDIVRPVQVAPDGSCWLVDLHGENTGTETDCPPVTRR
ncbi:MAG TPA: hypothetical protein VII33_14485, partial [Nakamurella sp.]